MANNNSLTETDRNCIHGSFKLPRIKIPKVLVEGDWGQLSFKIETTHGTIKVTTGYRKRWECHGDVHSLVAAGFIESNWCPGLPGNNKTRQTVLFENDTPQLIYGNRAGRAIPDTHITIERTSKNMFTVVIPATEKQKELISQSRTRWDERWKKEQLLKEEQEKRKQKPDRYSNPALFKDFAIRFLDIGIGVAMKELRGEHEFSNYGEMTIWIDEQSAQDVLCASERLIEMVRKAKVVCRRKEPNLSIVNSSTVRNHSISG